MFIIKSSKSWLNRSFATLFFISLFLIAPRAQQPAPVTAAQSPEDRIALYQALLDLTNPWTVMCVAAHPDDEDGTSLIVMRRKYGAHTVSLFSTFGEGGQNAIGPELYEELGAIRARETMAASEIQGSEPHFLGLKDFGFSKSADETFQKWGHEEALRRMVLQIRKLRPDVIITNHSITSNDHGHHQATARLVVEAFDTAADPKRFPDQLKDSVTTWQVQRLFVRVRGSQPPPADAPLVTIDPNERDPVRGTMFAEQALSALQKHATQGPWPRTFAEFTARFRAFSGQSSATGQMPLIRYALVREAKSAGALPNGSHNFPEGLRLAGKIAKQLEPPIIDGHQLLDSVNNHEIVLKALISEAKRWDRNREQALESGDPFAPDSRRVLRMAVRFDAALAAASGVFTTLEARESVVSPGSKGSVDFVIRNHGSTTLRPLAFVIGASYRTNIIMNPVQNNATKISPGEVVRENIAYDVPNATHLNVPKAAHLYDDRIRGFRITVGVNLSIGDVTFILPAETTVDVAPQLEISNISPSPIVQIPVANLRARSSASQCLFRDLDYSLRLTNNDDTPFEGQIVRGVLSGRTRGEGVNVARHSTSNVTLIVPGCDARRTDAAITFTILTKNRQPVATIKVPVVSAAAHVAPNLRIGYLRGFDFSLPNALNALGVESKELSVDEVRNSDLSRFTSIIVDNRVYESQPELISVNPKLLDYARDGGNLIVFYHKSDEWNPDARRNRPQLAPHKLVLGNERITDENAPITFIEPQHPLVNTPNKLGPEDFAGWIQERGLYYPREWDPQFRALLQTNDPGEAPLKGGLLVADYGKGHYLYTSMVWYRQLRAGVPGAYRMLANMISYGREK
jgi:LmbE family N-acetylglucosaminyl deacetylase